MEKKTVAVFDFDGTLTAHDTFIPFLRHAIGLKRTLIAILLAVPRFIGFLFGTTSRQEVKEYILTKTLGGLPLTAIEAMGDEFARGPLPSLTLYDRMEKVRWHKKQGHPCILVSATLDIYLKPWCAVNGFEPPISTKLAADSGGIATGKIHGANCWGPEKRRRLLEKLGDRAGYTLYVYGDSRGDKEILEMADYPTRY